jgi:hypothetical protein
MQNLCSYFFTVAQLTLKIKHLSAFYTRRYDLSLMILYVVLPQHLVVMLLELFNIY